MIRHLLTTDVIAVDRRNPAFCGTCRWLEAFADSCARFPTAHGMMRRLTIGAIESGPFGELGYLRCKQCRKAESK